MQLIKGKKIADDILNNIKSQIEKEELKPTLAVILIGEDEASKIYVGLKEKAAREIEMNFKLYKYEAEVKEEIVLNKIEEINNDNDIHGVIVQLPLPKNLDKHKIINAINPEKDVDGFCDENQKCFSENRETLFPVFPKAIMKMVESVLKEIEMKNRNLVYEDRDSQHPLFNSPPQGGGEGSAVELFGGKNAVVVCKSDDFGKIMQKAFEKIEIGSEYIFCDKVSEEENSNMLKEADIVVTACGIKNLINSQMVKDKAVIIDGGIVKEDGKVYGDVDLESFRETDCFISPVPGGVGPVTVACLLENTYLAHHKSTNRGMWDFEKLRI